MEWSTRKQADGPFPDTDSFYGTWLRGTVPDHGSIISWPDQLKTHVLLVPINQLIYPRSYASYALSQTHCQTHGAINFILNNEQGCHCLLPDQLIFSPPGLSAHRPEHMQPQNNKTPPEDAHNLVDAHNLWITMLITIGILVWLMISHNKGGAVALQFLTVYETPRSQMRRCKIRICRGANIFFILVWHRFCSNRWEET